MDDGETWFVSPKTQYGLEALAREMGAIRPMPVILTLIARDEALAAQGVTW